MAARAFVRQFRIDESVAAPSRNLTLRFSDCLLGPLSFCIIPAKKCAVIQTN